MKCLLILLSIFEISDGLMTQLLVSSGMVSEGNPIMRSIVSQGNFLLLKLVGIAISVLIIWTVYKRLPDFALAITSSIVIFYGAVLFWNMSIFFKV